MRKLLSALPLVAILASSAVSHAATLSGQFSVLGDLTDTGSALNFIDAQTSFSQSALTGDFAKILTTNETVAASNATLNYKPYVAGSEIFTIGGLTVNLQTLVNVSAGMFNGTALLNAAGYDPTMANIQLTTQTFGGPVSFSATANATSTSPVPEPSTLALLGTGVLGAAGAIRRRFSM